MASNHGWSEVSNVWRFAWKYALWAGWSSPRGPPPSTLATAGIVFGSYQRWGFGVLVGQAEDVLDDDDLAVRVRRGRLDRVHEGVVADPVLHDQLRLAHLLRPRWGSPRRCADRCWGCRESTRHVDVMAADLAEHVGVLVLGPDGVDHASGGRAGGLRFEARSSEGQTATRAAAAKAAIRTRRSAKKGRLSGMAHKPILRMSLITSPRLDSGTGGTAG